MEYFELEVATCRKCEGAAFQTFPVPYAGSFGSKRIIIGQNPGKIKDSDEPRQFIFRVAAPKLSNPSYSDTERAFIVHMSYEQDFLSSPAYKIMGRVFGEDWIEDWCFTNAVRCRTPENQHPSDQMIRNCWDYTQRMLTGKEVVVMMGRVAALQVARSVGRDFEELKPVVNKKRGIAYLQIPHFARWPYMKADEILAMKEAIYKITREGVVGGTL